MKGYHTFELNKEPSEWFEAELLVQLLSILYWKRHGNEIGLFANERFAELLHKYEMDSLYSDINILKSDYKIDKDRFWSMPKILCHQDIKESEYCILDTDMFLRKMPALKPVSYVAAHCEWHYTVSGKLVYPTLDMMLSGEKLKQFSEYEDVMPTNTSFLYINDKELVEKWSEYALEVAIESSKVYYEDPFYGEMMTIEQRFLPIIARILGKRYSVLITNTYVPALQHKTDGSEWTPKPNEGGNILDMSKIYFHLWGFKKQFDNPLVRNQIVKNLNSELKQNFGNEYNKIIDKFLKIKNQI